MLTKPEQRVSPHATVPIEDAGLRALTQRQVKRVSRLKMNVAAWGLGAILLTAGWVVHEWQANGAFERFAHEGSRGDWNPTLWALAVLVWALVVGIMALRVYFERPPRTAEIDREVERLQHAIAEDDPADAALRRLARERLERVSRLRFQVAAWLLAMLMLTPVNALIEWQDNGAFQRLSRNSKPGSWDPWILYAGCIWACVVVVFYALPVYLDRRKTKVEIEKNNVKGLRSNN
jgi:hypothetical protein